MRNPVASIKTLVLLSTIVFAGHALATQDTWFSVTANGSNLDLDNASTNGITEGVEVDQSVLSIDLPTSEVFPITPGSDTPAGATEGKTYIDVDGAVFTPTYTNDIDNTVLDGAQTALTVAYDDTPTTNYYAYIGGDWIKLTGATPTSSSVNVRVELDYSNIAVTNAAFKIGDVYLRSAADGETWQFPISGSQRALGRVDLAGYGKIHSITSTVEAVANITVTPGTVTYGADFTNVTITATVDGTGYDTANYTLTWNGSPVDGYFTRTDNTITITAPIVFDGRDSVEYVISVNGNAATNQTTVVAYNRNWITENKDSKNQTGIWNPVSYNDAVAAVSDTSTYTANSCTTGDLVTITFENLVYTELSDLSVTTPSGTQGAFALAETNLSNSVSTNFMILVKPENSDYVWTMAEWDGGMPSTNVAYIVEMAFNYTNDTYSVKVNGEYLRVNSGTEFPICVTSTRTRYVEALEFRGSGTLTGIKGVDSIGYMAKDDVANRWYKSIDDAINSGSNGPFTILYGTGGTSNPRWKIETVDGVMKLIKKVAKGMFFMAY